MAGIFGTITLLVVLTIISLPFITFTHGILTREKSIQSSTNANHYENHSFEKSSEQNFKYSCYTLGCGYKFNRPQYDEEVYDADRPYDWDDEYDLTSKPKIICPKCKEDNIKENT
ncbi:hypothetical protein CN918_31540 [Priestia megaterium]|nr:hypothetical protein CN918_31540 [Priestia megaterium]